MRSLWTCPFVILFILARLYIFLWLCSFKNLFFIFSKSFIFMTLLFSLFFPDLIILWFCCIVSDVYDSTKCKAKTSRLSFSYFTMQYNRIQILSFKKILIQTIIFCVIKLKGIIWFLLLNSCDFHFYILTLPFASRILNHSYQPYSPNTFVFINKK